jgi:type I site-specific restriction endonuclease
VNRPFENREMREAHESSNRSNYDFSVIRVNFPNDNLVVQMQMPPDQTIDQLLRHIKELVDDQKTDLNKLYLFTVPPKTVLSLERTIQESGLIPAAFIHIGGSSSSLLKEDLMHQVSNYEDVHRYTSALRELQKHL